MNFAIFVRLWEAGWRSGEYSRPGLLAGPEFEPWAYDIEPVTSDSHLWSGKTSIWLHGVIVGIHSYKEFLYEISILADISSNSFQCKPNNELGQDNIF